MSRVLPFLLVWVVFVQLAYSSILKEPWLTVARSRFEARIVDSSTIEEREEVSLPLQIADGFPLSKREAKGGGGSRGGGGSSGGASDDINSSGGSSSGGRGGAEFPDGGQGGCQQGCGAQYGGGQQSGGNPYSSPHTTSSSTSPLSRTTTTIDGTPFVILAPTILPVSSAKDLFLPGVAGTTSNGVDFLVISATTNAQVLALSTQSATTPASTTSSLTRYGSSATTTTPGAQVVSLGVQNRASAILCLCCSLSFGFLLV